MIGYSCAGGRSASMPRHPAAIRAQLRTSAPRDSGVLVGAARMVAGSQPEAGAGAGGASAPRADRVGKVMSARRPFAKIVGVYNGPARRFNVPRRPEVAAGPHRAYTTGRTRRLVGPHSSP